MTQRGPFQPRTFCDSVTLQPKWTGGLAPEPCTLPLPTGSVSPKEWNVLGLSSGEANRVSLQINCLFPVLLLRSDVTGHQPCCIHHVTFHQLPCNQM